MDSLTLDVSCALNFLNSDESADTAVMALVRAGMTGTVDLVLSQEAFDEVAGTEDDELRAQRLARLAAFERLEPPASREHELDDLADDLLRALFPNSEPGSRTYDHNRRDCRQLAAHKMLGRSAFVTRDHKLLKRREAAAPYGIKIVAPSDALPSPAKPSGGDPALRSITLRRFVRNQDEGSLRAVLEPLGADYPDFDGWLTKSIQRPQTRITLGESQGQVAAAAVTAPKDGRVQKLAAFYVADAMQGSGLGSHLLWNEMRDWIEHEIDKVYVTVSSRKAWLLRFFALYGFVLEGVSARRYNDTSAELVLGKHLLRRRIDEAARDAFAQEDAPVLFSLPPHVEVEDTIAATGQRFATAFGWTGAGRRARLVEHVGDQERRSWTLGQLEHILYPARFPAADREAIVVPIEPVWADRMVEFAARQASLLEPEAEERRLLLRTDNVYYAYPKCTEIAEFGTPILLYVKEPVSAIIGDARLLQVTRGGPDELFRQFGGLGVYNATQIADHVIPGGPNAGTALALRFGHYVAYREHVSLSRLHDLVGRKLTPQGLTPVSFEEYEAIRRTGGVEW